MVGEFCFIIYTLSLELYQGTDSRIKEAPLLDAMGLLSLLGIIGE
jgi:hypothetical protein